MRVASHSVLLIVVPLVNASCWISLWNFICRRCYWKHFLGCLFFTSSRFFCQHLSRSAKMESSSGLTGSCPDKKETWKRGLPDFIVNDFRWSLGCIYPLCLHLLIACLFPRGFYFMMERNVQYFDLTLSRQSTVALLPEKLPETGKATLELIKNSAI